MSNKKIIKSVASGGPTRRATSITQSDPIVKAKPTIAPGASWISYTTIALFVAISYIFLVPWYADYVNHVLPHNDPFTYTLNWFQVIDDYRSGDYLRTLASYLFYPDNWDRLMDLSVAALAPFLTKEPYFICIVNYALFGVATATFYRLGLRLTSSTSASLAVAWVPWLWPVTYGFSDLSSLPVLALDAAFIGALYWAVAQAYIFVFDLSLSVDQLSVRNLNHPWRSKAGLISWSRTWMLPRTTSALWTGLVIGIAIWGRGNSLPTVGLVVLWPALLALKVAWRSRSFYVWISVTIVAFIAGLMTVQFYVQYWSALRDYYAVHMGLVESRRSLTDMMPFILNIPGFMYWRQANSFACLALTCATHIFVLSICAAVWRPKSRFRNPSYFALRHLITGGAVIYFGTYLVDMILFANGERGGPGCLNRISASISGVSASVKLPSGKAAR